MHNKLIEYVQNHSTSPLSEKDIDTIKSIFFPKKIRKRQYLLQEGDVCNSAAFIIKGAMRQYHVDEKGIEHMVYLSLENWWALDRESYQTSTPSNYFIDAWEETEVLIISKEDSEKYIDAIPAFRETSKTIGEKNSFALLNRIQANISLGVEERYKKLNETYPEFLERFPQHIIASYLGVTKETLSRIRNKSHK